MSITLAAAVIIIISCGLVYMKKISTQQNPRTRRKTSHQPIDPTLQTALLNQLAEQTRQPFIQLKLKTGSGDLYASKLGGTPYLPPDYAYPCQKNGEPLRLLTQINFTQIPPLEGFPDKGILQFYISQGSSWGMDYDDPTNQDSYRVIYHEHILSDIPTPHLPAGLLENDDFPFSGECLLEPRVETMSITLGDFRSSAAFQTIINQQSAEVRDILQPYCNDDSLHYSDELEDARETYQEAHPENGHRLGGYPFFTQEDPRFNPSLARYSTLLLQIDTDSIEGDLPFEIMWGDCGVANFFITPEALQQRDFSDVLYNWDCY